IAGLAGTANTIPFFSAANTIGALTLGSGLAVSGGALGFSVPLMPLGGGTFTGTVTGADGTTWGSGGIANGKKIQLNALTDNHPFTIEGNRNESITAYLLNDNTGGTAAGARLDIGCGADVSHVLTLARLSTGYIGNVFGLGQANTSLILD